MALNGFEFNGYWDANANRVLGLVGVKLYDTPRQRVQMYQVSVGGTTKLGNSDIWFEGDFALYNGYEWCKILGPLGAAAAMISILSKLPSVPSASPVGLWNDGGLLAISGEVDYSISPGGPPPPSSNRDVLELDREPTPADVAPGTFRAVKNIITGRTSIYVNNSGTVVDLLA